MQVKSQICTERSSTDDPEQDDSQKKTSCFSNIKIFLVSECALMLAQGTVGAYLVSVKRARRRFSVYLAAAPFTSQLGTGRQGRKDAVALEPMQLITTLFRSPRRNRSLRRLWDAD